MAQKPAVITRHICGPNRGKCVCRCPNECGHEFSGPVENRRHPSGALSSSITCVKCGMSALDHDMGAVS